MINGENDHDLVAKHEFLLKKYRNKSLLCRHSLLKIIFKSELFEASFIPIYFMLQYQRL